MQFLGWDWDSLMKHVEVITQLEPVYQLILDERQTDLTRKAFSSWTCICMLESTDEIQLVTFCWFKDVFSLLLRNICIISNKLQWLLFIDKRVCVSVGTCTSYIPKYFTNLNFISKIRACLKNDDWSSHLQRSLGFRVAFKVLVRIAV